MRQKAREYACVLSINYFKAIVGRLNRFKARHEIGKVLRGESASADDNSAPAWMLASLTGILKDCPSADVFNTDEIGLFYEMLPSPTLDFKGSRCPGGKQSKKRISLVMPVPRSSRFWSSGKVPNHAASKETGPSLSNTWPITGLG